MRRASVLLSVVTLVLIGLLVGGRVLGTTAQDASPVAAGQSFVGSWRITVNGVPNAPLLPTIATFAADGTFIHTTPPVVPALPGSPYRLVFFSAGHGSWASAGMGAATVTFVHLTTDENGTYLGTQTVQGGLQLDGGGDDFTGVFTVEEADPLGNVVDSFAGTVRATRIAAEPLETSAVGSPEASTPAP